MSLKVDLETNFAECVLNVGKVTLGDKQRAQMDPGRQSRQATIIFRAVCALLNSGGGVVKIEIENKDYSYKRDGVGLKWKPIFRGYLDEMQQDDQDLFYIFVKSWNAEASGVRFATLSSNLYQRNKTSTNVLTSQEALEFLKEKIQSLKNNHDSSSSTRNFQEGVQNEGNIMASAEALFDRTSLRYLEKLNFTRSTHVEFKMFSEKVLECFDKAIPSCVSAFANTEGGYIFWGVHEETLEVIGCEKEKMDDLTTLKNYIGGCIRKLPVYHFCTQKCEIKYALKFLEVYNQGALHGYVCAVRVEPFCCVVFAKEPGAWMVKDNCVRQLDAKEWVTWMTEADPDPSRCPEMVLERSLSSTTPHSRSVYTHRNLECLKEQQKRYFPVSPDLLYRPQSLFKELFSQHKGLRNLINKQMRLVSEGMLIFSRSWAVDVGLQEKEGVICDALLLSPDKIPVLYTIFREHSDCWKDYCLNVARTLKQKLVNTGGYTGKLCIIPSAFLLNPDTTADSLSDSTLPCYPESYKLKTTQDMEALLQSLVIVLCGFTSFLSEELGSEVLNLLTDKQYELLSVNLRETRKLFVHGLPGSGKTILALKIMEKIRNVFHCQPGHILYICENKPLQEFVSRKNICVAVTRKAFMGNNSDFETIQHIIIDEAQNFRNESGSWYKKAETITQRENDTPGILWTFLDYFQTSHTDVSGLPDIKQQYPRKELTRVVRNAEPIANYLQEILHKVRNYPPPNIPPEFLEILREVKWSQGVAGKFEMIEKSNMEEMVSFITEKCDFLLRNGYSYKDIAVICSNASEVQRYKPKLQRAMRKRNVQHNEKSDQFIQIRDASDVTGNHIVVDSVRRFSGLERNIVFGINPEAAETAVYHNLLLCLASRARKHLYILKVSN